MPCVQVACLVIAELHLHQVK